LVATKPFPHTCGNCSAIRPTNSPPRVSRQKIGARRLRKRSSVRLRSFRDTAPIAPVTNPRHRNQGNWVRLVNSNGATLYQGRMPKKLRDTIVATTEANTSGANRLIEKFPRTIKSAKTAPEIGAL